MDQNYIFHLFSLQHLSMLTTIFRIGPLVILEFGLATAAVVITLFMDLPPCSHYTLGYLTLITFLIEMIASLKMMKTHSPLRKKYLCVRVTESDKKYYCRLVWDNLNILLVIMLLYYSLVVDGLSLSALQDNLKATVEGNSQNCQFTLFALCLFTQLQKTFSGNPGDQDIMVMWLLYAASAFLTTIVFVTFSKEYYQYCSSIKANRKLNIQLGSISQTLLDCHIYSFSSSMAINERLRDQVGSCSICLHQILEQKQQKGQKVVRLRCGHLFHKQCIDKWLIVKDHCPFRCYS